LFLFAYLSVFRADIFLIESKPRFEGNLIAKLGLKIVRPTDRRTRLGLDASSQGIQNSTWLVYCHNKCKQ
jgi:hypothetical protein